jgi:hypothetical protein
VGDSAWDLLVFITELRTWKERKGYNTLVLVAPEELVFHSAALDAVPEPCERLEVEWL